MSLCSVENCSRTVRAKGVCSVHYMRLRQYGRTDLIRRENGAKNRCGKDDCPAASRLRSAIYKMKHGDIVRAGQRRHYERYKDIYLARALAQPAEKRAVYRQRWIDKNPSKRHLHNKSRREHERHAPPPWLTDAQWEGMERFYREARKLSKETGVDHEVDHIVPLQGKIVCGLHVPWNLRVITAVENARRPRIFSGL